MRKNIVFAGVIIFILALLYFLSTEEFVQIPLDKEHINITNEKVCLDCHGEGRKNQLSKEHPPKYQCLKCHKRALKSEK